MISRFSVFYLLIFCLITLNGYSQIQPPFTLGNDTTLCEGDFIFFILPNSNGETYLWEDGTTGPYHLIMTEGLYHVMTTHNEDEHADSIYVNIQPQHQIDLGVDTVICISNPIYYEVDTFGLNVDDIYWNTGATSAGISIVQPGWYWVDVTVDFCTARDSIYVRSWYEGVGVFDGDRVFCEENHDSILITIPDFGGNHLWNTGDTTNSIKIYDEGEYWVTITDSCGIITDTFDLISLNSDDLGFGFDDTILCHGYNIQLDMPNVDVDMIWSTGDTASEIVVDDPGDYWACINWGDCSYCDTVTVDYYDVFDRSFLDEDYYLCEGDSVEIALPTDSDVEITWADTILDPEIDTLVIKETGKFVIRIEEGECKYNYAFYVLEQTCDTAEIIRMPNVFTPNGDGINDFLHPVNAEAIDEYRIRVYNRWGIEMYDGTHEEEGWDGTYEGIECPVGMYYWVFDFVFTKGTVKGSPWTGNVLLVRSPE